MCYSVVEKDELLPGHGNITSLTDSSGTVVKSYTYDAFGVEESIDSSDTNPFRYCGEYYDSEIEQIYLRARYYDPSLGRFTQSDPARDGVNWYVYCSNNPLAFIDPLGLFDYNTRLTMNMQYNEDVEVLQNELVYLGYLQRNDTNWGYFDGKTLAAVNRYKDAMGLGNTGKDRGVVGLQTWSSLGLQYRTQKDIDAGVKMVMWGGRRQYKDISKPVNDALWNARWEFEQHKGDLGWFAATVGDTGKWNIKRNDATWENALGMSFPGYGTPMLLKGQIVYVEDVGNITYGYLGTASGISSDLLIAGSVGNHILNHGIHGWGNELSDDEAIFKGIAWFYGNWYGQ